MTAIRKWLILTHRYVGTALSPLFVLWFASGIAMIYARDMPRLTPDVRLDRVEPIPFDRVRLTVEQVKDALPPIAPDRIVLLAVMGRPAYRFTTTSVITVFADTGETLQEIGRDDALTIAARFMRVPVTSVHYANYVTTADQWTIGQRRQLPLHEIMIDDADQTHVYVSPELGDVVHLTTSGTRRLAWIAAIPHWFYFASLRLNDQAWRQVVIWSSGIGTLLALLGIVLGIVQLRPTQSLQVSQLGRWIPYSGGMRWHHITGLVFGVFTLTWVFSGMLSMDPWNWSAPSGNLNLRYAMSGGVLELSRYPSAPTDKWRALPDGARIKEVEFIRIQDQPYYLVRRSPEPTRSGLLVSADSIEARQSPFTEGSLLGRIRAALPNVAMQDVATLDQYDAYYYARNGEAPLPILRVKLDDPDRTWLYIDPRSGQILRRIHHLGRIERWLYTGLHSLDFSFWYGRGRVWDVGVILLLAGGLVSSSLGFWLGMKRTARAVRRIAAS